MTLDATIAANLAAIRSRIADAARRAGRRPEDVRLVAVSKTFGPDHVRAAWAASQRDFGENKVQEALQKLEATADIEIRWHLIGHLQSNKARKAATAFAAIHSVDSMDLLRRIDDAEQARPYFARLRRLRDRLVADGVPAAHLADLSMGMSHDFEVAIQEGATLVRIGTAIFGKRTVRT